MIARFQMLVKNITSDRMIAKRPVAKVSNVMSILGRLTPRARVAYRDG